MLICVDGLVSVLLLSVMLLWKFGFRLVMICSSVFLLYLFGLIM